MAAVLEKRAPVLMPDDFGLVEEKRTDFVANVEVGVTPEDIIQPGFWSHVAPQLSAMSMIEVWPHDCAWLAKLRVIYAERNYAKVIMESFLQIDQKAAPVEASRAHSVEWKGPKHLFAVIRKSDNEILRAGFKLREEANAWLIEYEKQVR